MSETDLATLIATSRSWREVATRLGKTPSGPAVARLRKLAEAAQIDCGHLRSAAPAAYRLPEPEGAPSVMTAGPLRRYVIDADATVIAERRAEPAPMVLPESRIPAEALPAWEAFKRALFADLSAFGAPANMDIDIHITADFTDDKVGAMWRLWLDRR